MTKPGQTLGHQKGRSFHKRLLKRLRRRVERKIVKDAEKSTDLEDFDDSDYTKTTGYAADQP